MTPIVRYTACTVMALSTMFAMGWFVPRRNQTFQFSFRPAAQPRGIAFLIWSVIFALAIAQVVYLGTSSTLNERDIAAAYFLSATLTMCGLWLAVVDEKNRELMALAVLAIATGISLGSVYVSNIFSLHILTKVLSELLAGWLCVATSLGLILYAGEDSALNSRYAILIPAVATGVVSSMIRGAYILPLPVAWACIFSFDRKTPTPSILGFLLGVAASVASASIL